jgi:hypothetical protein
VMELAETSAAPATHPGLPLRQQGDGGASGRFRRWASRHNSLLTIAAAIVVPILYLLFGGSPEPDWSQAQRDGRTSAVSLSAIRG